MTNQFITREPDKNDKAAVSAFLRAKLIARYDATVADNKEIQEAVTDCYLKEPHESIDEIIEELNIPHFIPDYDETAAAPDIHDPAAVEEFVRGKLEASFGSEVASNSAIVSEVSDCYRVECPLSGVGSINRILGELNIPHFIPDYRA